MLTPTEAAELADVLRDAEQHATETGRSVLARDLRHWRDVLKLRSEEPAKKEADRG